jgi:hypothetical protein
MEKLVHVGGRHIGMPGWIPPSLYFVNRRDCLLLAYAWSWFIEAVQLNS